MIDRKKACEASVELGRLVQDLQGATGSVGPVPLFALRHYLNHAEKAIEALDEAMISDLADFVEEFLADDAAIVWPELPFED
jgi:hypothetical protein